MAGITDDMDDGKRFTIRAFDTKSSNKKETPSISEILTETGMHQPVAGEKKMIIGVDKEKKFITLCAWCDPEQKFTKQVEADGWTASHGMCPFHHDEMFMDFLKDKSDGVAAEGIEEKVSVPLEGAIVFPKWVKPAHMTFFLKKAPKEYIQKFDQLLKAKKLKAAWSLFVKVIRAK